MWGAEILSSPVRQGPVERPLVALTIDDGWSSRDDVLAVLQEYRVRPTLFLTGRAVGGDRGFIGRALEARCEIANHTWDHYDLVGKSADYVQKDLADFESFVVAAGGTTTRPFMRPSGGSLDQTVIAASAAAGYRPILWSSSCGDGSVSTTPEQMASNALASAKPGSIILMHFGPRAVVALPILVEGLRGLGLEPVSLSELFRGA